MKNIFTFYFLMAILPAFSQSTTIVISQAYGGGGGSTGTYLNDYVELHNVTNAAQLLTGYSLQYGSATGVFASNPNTIYLFPDATSIPAGAYLLIQVGSTGTAGAALPVTPDLTTTNISMAATSGKIALVNGTISLGCGTTAFPCTLPAATIIDLVAYGAANNAEGGVSAKNGVALTSTQGAVRQNSGCTDTDNNNTDFDIVTGPVPRNTSSPVINCTTLPVTLAYIKGQKAGGGNTINWKVNCFSTNIVMEIERAANTRNFISIYTLAATQARCQQPFDFKDAQPLAGRNYYRLKMIDVDGKVSYSPILGILNGSKGLEMVGLYPSLVKSETMLSISAARPTTMEAIITDMSGRIVKSIKQQLPAGSSLLRVDCSNLAPGTYHITGTSEETSPTTLRFMKF